jgi:hypothetical protein
MPDKSTPTFIAEEIPFSTATTVSGASLRLGYVFRAESKYIGDIFLARIANPADPTIDIENFDERTWENLRSVWRREAEIKFPDEGDYVMQMYDLDTDSPILLGEEVTFIGGDIREVPGGQGCIEYNWDLSGIVVVDPSINVMTISYTDCFNNPQTITKTVDAWGPNYEICANNPNPNISISGGVITPGAFCDLTFKMCTRYFLDLTGLPSLDPVSVGYIDCNGVSTGIVSTVGSIPRYYCAQIDTITASVGTLVFEGSCV